VTLAALALVIASSWAVGGWALCRVQSPGLRRFESIALTLTAGLGLIALLLFILALCGWFAYATPVLLAVSAAAAVRAVRPGSDVREVRATPAWRAAQASGSRHLAGWDQALWAAIVISAGLVGAALVIALGAPVAAFQVASAKEDLLMLSAAAACALCLAGGGWTLVRLEHLALREPGGAVCRRCGRNAL
jgi:hypothetical protein